jgi:catechol 2,3-dioxygenase
MTTLPLDTRDLLAVLDGDPGSYEGLPEGTTMGHVHLRVGRVDPTTEFYRDGVGFELQAELGPQATFLSAGGYHHHVAGNTWESAGAAYAPGDTARLEQVTILVPEAADIDEVEARVGGERIPEGLAVRDPSGNPILVRAA